MRRWWLVACVTAGALSLAVSCGGTRHESSSSSGFGGRRRWPGGRPATPPVAQAWRNLVRFSRYDDAGGDVFLCFQPAEVCGDHACSTWSSDAGETLLHELSHAWMYQNVTESTRQAFLRLVGVSRWEDVDDDWEERGVEHAANTMMVGLSDEPLAMDPGPCQVFDAKFRLLTGVGPLAPCSTPGPTPAG